MTPGPIVFPVKRLPSDARDAFVSLCSRRSFSDRQREQLVAVLNALLGDPRAPTSIRAPLAAVHMHLADSLVGLEVEELAVASAIVDLGSGAGLPGVPLATALPASHVTLIESQARRCAFLADLVSATELDNVAIVNARAERWNAGIGRQGAVVARALAPLAVVAEYAAPLLMLGGVLVDWRGRRDEKGESAALAAAQELGLERREIRRVRPFPAAQERHLHVYLKVAATPARFPRRPGVALKRPLGDRNLVSGATVTADDRDHR